MALILIVDDEVETLKPLMRLLQAQGYSVAGASNAFEALSATQHSNPDLILLDVMIPPMDGLTFLMRLREEPQGRAIPVIVVSGLSDSHTVNRAKDLGVREHLVKSQFTTQDLLDAVKRNIRPKPSTVTT